MLATRTPGSMMVDADASNELWRHPSFHPFLPFFVWNVFQLWLARQFSWSDGNCHLGKRRRCRRKDAKKLSNFFLPPKKSKKENFKFCPEHFCYHLPNTYTFTGLWNSLQINILIQNQCDQIGLLLNDLGNKLSYNSSPNLYQRLGYYEKCHFWREKLL